MQNNSRTISGQQEPIHPNLATTLTKHVQTVFRRPIQTYNQQAFAELQSAWPNNMPLILDTGCGTGDSSRNLALQNPAHFVVGIDQSVVRLNKQRSLKEPENLLLLRADLIDFWRLCYLHQVTPEQHYLLYPNPWPKKKHFQRRWCGHAVFPFILGVGGKIEFRSNWQTYAREMQFSFNQLGIESTLAPFTPEKPITPFELKYLNSQHQLYRVNAQVDRFSCPALDVWLAENRCY